ncbi:MAG TPA: HEAT repeat domain-containing protein [Roseiflexaceae bacterium]|nr:HEAT repeat domain-containing protein [Roseiflexaceae bacterium]
MHTIAQHRQRAEDLARAWATAPGLPEAAVGRAALLERMLGRLAYSVHASRPDGAVSEGVLLAALCMEWATMHGQNRTSSEAAARAVAFLQAVREHTELLVERAPGWYAFHDQMLQEYYAAHYLVADREFGVRLIRLRLHDPHWDRPILLALALVGEHSPEAATSLLERAVLAQGDDAAWMSLQRSRHEGLLGRDYLFALRCLAEGIPVLPRLMRPLIERLADETLRRTGLAAYARYREQLDACLAALGGPTAALLVPMLISGLRGPAREPRLRAAAALGRLGAPEGVAALRAALEQGDPELRRAAVRALGEPDGPVETVPVLRVALDQADPELRREAVTALGRLGAAEGVTEALRAALGDRSSVVRMGAAATLIGQGFADAQVRAVLHEGLGAEHPSERFLAVRTLGGLPAGAEGVVADLRAALDDADPAVRREALVALGGQGGEDAAAVLRAALEHADPATRIQTLGALGGLPGEGGTAVAALRVWLGHDDWTLRREAVRVLGLLQGQPGVAEVLGAALRDPVADVRREAVRSLAALSPGDEAVAELAALADDPDPEVRREVFRALEALGAGSVAALAALRTALLAADHDVRVGAAGALAALGETSDALSGLALAGLPDAADWQTRYQLAGYLGRAAQPDVPVLDVLLGGLLDRDNTVRQACAAALALLGRRFPEQLPSIEARLLDALADPAFARLDRISKRTGHDYAHEALWRLTAEGGTR